MLILHELHPYLLTKPGPWARLAIEAAAVLLLGTAVWRTPNASGFPWPWSLLAIVGALLAIASGGMPPHALPGPLGQCYGLSLPLLGQGLAHPWMVYVGKLSYPLYLWHWPTLVLFRHTVMLRTPATRAAAAGVVLFGALFLYHVVEAAVRRWKPRRQAMIPAVLLSGVGCVAALLGVLRGSLAS